VDRNSGSEIIQLSRCRGVDARPGLTPELRGCDLEQGCDDVSGYLYTVTDERRPLPYSTESSLSYCVALNE
jgi:hypothetical protein